MNAIVDVCVKSLYAMAGFTGLTYKQINVIIFCIIWPVISLMLFAVVILQYRKIKRLTPR